MSSDPEPEESFCTISCHMLGELFGLAAENVLLKEQLTALQARLEREVPYLREEIKGERDLRTLTGSSPAMKAVRLAIQQVARTDSTVLIIGETGTGKELVARAIHQLSPRRDHLLVTVNCAAQTAVPEPWFHFVQLNAERSLQLREKGGPLTEKQQPLLGPGCKKV